MIGYRQFRREAEVAFSPAGFGDWLVGVRYQLWARAVHAVGLHCYRLRWRGSGPRVSLRCTWCGSLRPGRHRL